MVDREIRVSQYQVMWFAWFKGLINSINITMDILKRNYYLDLS